MAIPIQAQARYGAREFDSAQLPSISSREDGPGRAFGASSRGIPFNDNLSPAAGSVPMAIRGVAQNLPPPPLPPPPLVPIEGPIDRNLQHFKERRRDPLSPLSDSLGMCFERRDLSFKREFLLDEGYHSIRSPDLPSPFGLRSMDPNGIDSSMLNKLNRLARRSNLSASVNDLPAPRPNHPHPHTGAMSLPHRTKQQPYLDTSLTRSPVPISAVSPFSQSSASAVDYRSPLGSEVGDYERSPVPRPRRTDSGSIPDDASTQASCEIRDDESDFPMETSRMRTLNIEDQRRERDWDRDREMEHSQAGQKRRASSPPSDDIPLASNGVRRREGPLLTRGSPTPRLTVIPHGSVSSISSASRSGSYVSSLTASSMASIGSFGRRSPNGLSPGSLSPTDPSSPYATPLSVATSPRSALSRSIALQSPHQRTISEHTHLGATRLTSPRKLVELAKNPSSLVAAKMKGPYMCECCPKKPKKFDTEEELKIHEAEKQYECSFCGNRFKNKNEAERHQNSLHVRRHSWSCSALTGYERAFHDSTARPGEADTCGYCGDEFPRSGRNIAGVFITDQDWEDRIRHLQDVHKFRECNSSKKFYRADHFRQHLKHSHAGTSGKWTNMLENACMMEEDPPIAAR